ncbi:MAG: hypothetical protein RLZZ418_168 [Pseudomonadota bacterium]
MQKIYTMEWSFKKKKHPLIKIKEGRKNIGTVTIAGMQGFIVKLSNKSTAICATLQSALDYLVKIEQEKKGTDFEVEFKEI